VREHPVDRAVESEWGIQVLNDTGGEDHHVVDDDEVVITTCGDSIVVSFGRETIAAGLLLWEGEERDVVKAGAVEVMVPVVEVFLEDVLARMDVRTMADNSDWPPRISWVHRASGEVQIREGRALHVLRAVTKEVNLFGRFVAQEKFLVHSAVDVDFASICGMELREESLGVHKRSRVSENPQRRFVGRCLYRHRKRRVASFLKPRFVGAVVARKCSEGTSKSPSNAAECFGGGASFSPPGLAEAFTVREEGAATRREAIQVGEGDGGVGGCFVPWD
jgi:hypothetical protein